MKALRLRPGRFLLGTGLISYSTSARSDALSRYVKNPPRSFATHHSRWMRVGWVLVFDQQAEAKDDGDAAADCECGGSHVKKDNSSG